MAETVLLYHCEGDEWKKLRNMLVLVKLRVRVVKPEQYGMRIWDLVAGKGDASDAPYSGQGFDEPMLVFGNVHPVRLDPILEVVRRTDTPCVPLKAIMTPTNCEWNSEQLWQELCRERQTIDEQQTEESQRP